MAKKLRDEDLRLNIIVNGDQGRKEMIELAGSIQKTKQEVKLLQEENKKLRKSGQLNSEQYRNNETAIKSLNSTLDTQRAKLAQLNSSIKLVDKTWAELGFEAKRVKRLLDQSVPGSEQWKRYDSELAKVKRRMAEVRDQSDQSGSALNRMTSGIGKFVGRAAVVMGGVTAGFAALMQGVNILSALDDQLSSVQKTTGMTRAEVGRLSEALKSIDTRTTQEDLLNLARVAGKLGITGEQEVMQFVRAADQINVALSEDLGGTEEAVNSLGKLVDIFKLKDEFGLEDALLKTGSAINELGNAGTANEGYLVDFTQRMAGIAPAANISIQDILALAATMDELGQPVESSATAIGQFIVGLGKDIPKMAGVAGMSVKEFSNLLQTDGNAALIAVLRNLKSTGKGVEGLAKSMGMVGEDGARAVTALGTLSNNLELLTARQALSNEQFAIGNSLTKEANIQNNNLAANLEKLWNRVTNRLRDSSAANALNNIIGALAGANVETDNLTAEFESQRKKMNQLDATMPKLLSRYEELKSKTTLSKDEQVELKKVIGQIGEALPTSITKWDQYGNALGVNTVKAKALLEQQRNLLQYLQKDSIESQKKDIKLLESKFDFINNQVARGQKFVNSMTGGEWVKMTIKESEDALSKLKVVAKDLMGARANLRNLTGSNIKVSPTDPEVIEDPVVTNTPIIQNPDAEDPKKIAERAIKEFEQLGDSYKKLGLSRFMDQLTQNQKEIEQEKLKYNTLIEEGKAFLKQKGNTAEQRKAVEAENAKLEKERDASVAQIRINQERDLNKKIADFRRGLNEVVKTELEKERELINKHYDALELENAGNDAALAQLRLERQKDLSAAEISEKERLEREKKLIENKYRPTDSQRDRDIAVINEKYDAEIEALKVKYSKEIQITQEFQDMIAAINARRVEDVNNLETKDTQDKAEFQMKMAQLAADTSFSILANSRQRQSDMIISNLNRQKEAELTSRDMTDRERMEIEAKYAKRIRDEKLKAFKADKVMAIAQATINGALAVTMALRQTGVLSPFVIPGIIASTLAQIAIIASQKPPVEAEGYEGGGYIDVTRKQDGKKFRAKDRGERRGYFNRPSVLISENGEEFVASAQAVRNDTVRPFLDMIDSAQRNGTISTLNMERMFSRPISTGVMPGKEDGGYLSSSRTSSISSMPGSMTDSQILDYLKENTVVMQQLRQILSQPIEANVSLLGKRGFIEKQKEYDQIQDLGNL